MARAKAGHFICSICGQELPKEQKIVKNGKNHCKICLDKLEQNKLLEQNLLRDLINFLQLENIPGLITQQIRKYVTEYNYTYPGISYTVWYYLNVLNKSFDKQYGIAFVKYYYDEAKDYFLEIQSLEKSIPKEIKIIPKIVKTKTNNKKSVKNLYDLGSIGGQNNE